MFAFAESSQTRPRNKHVSGANIYLLADFSASLCSIACHLRTELRIVSPARFLHIANVFGMKCSNGKQYGFVARHPVTKLSQKQLRLLEPLFDRCGDTFSIESQICQKLVNLAMGNERVVYAQHQCGDRGLHVRQHVEHTFASAP